MLLMDRQSIKSRNEGERKGERDKQKDKEQEYLREVVSCSPTLSLSLKGGCRKGGKTQEIDREGGRREAKQERGRERETHYTRGYIVF